MSNELERTFVRAFEVVKPLMGSFDETCMAHVDCQLAVVNTICTVLDAPFGFAFSREPSCVEVCFTVWVCSVLQQHAVSKTPRLDTDAFRASISPGRCELFKLRRSV